MNLLRPDLYPSFFSFAFAHCQPQRTVWGWSFRGAENLDVLHRNLLQTMMIRRRKEDVLEQLPPKLRSVVLLDIERPAEYKLAQDNFLSWLRSQGKSTLGARRAEALVRLGYWLRLTAQLKFRSACSWIDTFLDSKEKLICFGIHKNIVGGIHARYRGVKVDGSTPGKQRQEAIDCFNKDPGTRILSGNLQAAGVGWNATACSSIAFLEFGWRPGDISQAEDRAHGLERGQKGMPTNIYFLVARGTIEEDLIARVQRKQESLDKVLDGGATESSLDLLDQLMKELNCPAEVIS